MKFGRPVTFAAVSITLLIVLGLAYHFALQRLKAGIEGALGPRASVGSLSVGWSGVQIESLRVRAVRGAWPAEDELRAARVRLVPSLASLWGSGWRVQHIEIEDAYLSILRSADGRLRVLPALLEQPAPAGSKNQPGAHVHIAQVALQSATLDVYDASVRQPPHAMRLDELRAKVGPLDWPALDTAADVSVQARFKGPNHDGRIQVDGTLTPATREAALKAKVQGVDLLALQPYLLRVNEGGVKRGTLDLALDARVKGKQLSAPGTLVLTNMELASGGSMFATFAGVPRQAVIAAMQRDGRIEVNFTLEGRLDDPAFSINDNLATRLAGGLAQALGVSIGGVVEGVGNVIKGLFGR